MTDEVATLALSMASNPGAYVLLLGSGVSRAAGIPTGWEVVEALIGRLAVAAGEPIPRDPAAWYAEKTGTPASYTTLVESLAPRQAERTGLLAGFFEATPADRDLGLKQPTRAHRAIAELVQLTVVRVIVTTNFDRLVETALADAGIAPTVVWSDDDLAGLPPLTQVRCLVVKAHGDYRDTRIRNTPDEVAVLDPGIAGLLDRLFREYGLLVVGWSAEYDAGLRGVLLTAGNGRYGAHWASRAELQGEAAALLASIGGRSIRITDADSFFVALLEAVKSVQELVRRGPLEDELAVATAKRFLAMPESRIALSDLVAAEVERVRAILDGPRPTSMTTPEEFRDWLERLAGGCRQLTRLYATIGYWGQSEQCQILHRGLERLTRWGVEGGIVIVLQSRMYPALLALYAAGVSAVAAHNFAVLARLLRARLPHTNPRYPGDEDTLAVPLVLNGPSVLAHADTNGVLNIGAERRLNYHTPPSVYLQRVLRPLVSDVIPGDAEFEQAFDTFEALLAMRYIVDGGHGVPTGQYAYRGNRSFVGRGVPEQLLAQEQREGSGWPPIASGLFDDLEQAEAAMAGLTERLSEFHWG